jgi:hypothetical protein
MTATHPARRSRAAYAALVVATIALGLASRRFAPPLPDAVRLYVGDVLWATTVYLLAATVWVRAPVAQLAGGALAFSFAVEASQLYHAPWIDSVRGTRPGALVLGFGFLWSDLACYTLGVAVAALVDVALSGGARRPSLPSPAGRNIV